MDRVVLDRLELRLLKYQSMKLALEEQAQLAPQHTLLICKLEFLELLEQVALDQKH